MRNIKCVIAAGGLGTRLKNFRNSDTTKILLEVNGIPMINRQIEQLNSWGLEEFVIITNPEFEILTRDIVKKRFKHLKISWTTILLRARSKARSFCHILFTKTNN